MGDLDGGRASARQFAGGQRGLGVGAPHRPTPPLARENGAQAVPATCTHGPTELGRTPHSGVPVVAPGARLRVTFLRRYAEGSPGCATWHMCFSATCPPSCALLRSLHIPGQSRAVHQPHYKAPQARPVAGVLSLYLRENVACTLLSTHLRGRAGETVGGRVLVWVMRPPGNSTDGGLGPGRGCSHTGLCHSLPCAGPGPARDARAPGSRGPGFGRSPAGCRAARRDACGGSLCWRSSGCVGGGRRQSVQTVPGTQRSLRQFAE